MEAQRSLECGVGIAPERHLPVHLDEVIHGLSLQSMQSYMTCQDELTRTMSFLEQRCRLSPPCSYTPCSIFSLEFDSSSSGAGGHCHEHCLHRPRPKRTIVFRRKPLPCYKFNKARWLEGRPGWSSHGYFEEKKLIFLSSRKHVGST